MSSPIPTTTSAPVRPGLSTLAIHAGTHPDPITGAVVVPISLATTFVQKSPGQHTVREMNTGERTDTRRRQTR